MTTKELQKAESEQRRKLAELSAQLGSTRDEFQRLAIAVDTAATATDARETGKLPQLSAAQLAARNRITALEKAIQMETGTLKELQKQLADAEDAEDDAAVEELADELRRKVSAVLADYLPRIEAHEERILRHKHAMALRSHGIAHLRQLYAKEKARNANG